MREILKKDILLRILAILIIAILSGISPLPHLVKNAMVRTGQKTAQESTVRTAHDLALIAKQLPWREGLWEKSGHYALEAGEIDLAIDSFKKAASLGALSAEGYLAFGDAYAASGNLYTAEQIWHAGLKIHGPSEDILTRIAEIQRTIKDDAGLINTLKALLEQQQSKPSPRLEFAQINLGIAQTNYELGLLLAVENPASASPYLLQAVELNPTLVDAGALAFTIQRALPKENLTYTLMAVGRELASQNKWDLAAKAFQKGTENQPGYSEGWAFLGEARQHLDEDSFKEALPALETALALDPDSLSANIFMALYWKRVGDLDQHYQYLTKAANIDPENPAILVDLGEASAILGDLETGYKYHLRAVELTYRDPTYLHALIRFCIRYHYNLREIALPTARQAVIHDHTDPATLDIMGQVLFRLGDLHNAQRFYLRAISRDPDYAPAYLHLGLVYSLQDQPEEAANAFARAIRLAPGTPTAFLAERFFDPDPFP